ncbi:integrase [Caudoviricetes sp.]|nr:integrase [Caudoviricetes sp.]
MVYRKASGQTYYTRVTDSHGTRRVCSTGTVHKGTAEAVEAWIKGLRGRHDPLGVLDAIVAARITLAQAFRLGDSGAAQWLADQRAASADTDLAPLLEAWAASRVSRRRGAVSTPKYVLQIVRLFPERPWRRSTLTTPTVAKRLDALPVSDPTKNRYRAALSAFCAWLMRRGEIEQNPARQVGGYSEGEQPVVFYTMAEAERVILALPAEWRGREALMAGTGADWSDTARLLVRDIDLTARTVRCHGSKTMWRNRTVRITQAWVIPHVRAALKGKLPDAPAFWGTEAAALRRHKAAVKACQLPATTLHQWRHTYAVNELRAKQHPTVVAHQLGHRDTSLVWKRYGRFVPELKDYRADSATDLATSPFTEAM